MTTPLRITLLTLLLIASCRNPADDFAQAEKTDTVEGFEAFLVRHAQKAPALAEKAEMRLAALKLAACPKPQDPARSACLQTIFKNWPRTLSGRLSGEELARTAFIACMPEGQAYCFARVAKDYAGLPFASRAKQLVEVMRTPPAERDRFREAKPGNLIAAVLRRPLCQGKRVLVRDLGHEQKLAEKNAQALFELLEQEANALEQNQPGQAAVNLVDLIRWSGCEVIAAKGDANVAPAPDPGELDATVTLSRQTTSHLLGPDSPKPGLELTSVRHATIAPGANTKASSPTEVSLEWPWIIVPIISNGEPDPAWSSQRSEHTPIIASVPGRFNDLVMQALDRALFVPPKP
jgi:hypothetical protein